MLYLALAVLGAAMAMTLYEPAFNVLTKRYPTRYTQGITTLTLVGGFASTLSFPAAAALIQAFGWRGALVCHRRGAAGRRGAVARLGAARPGAGGGPRGADEKARCHAARGAAPAQFWLLTLCFTSTPLRAALWAHVMPAFAAKGLSEAQALAVLVWIGPAQVAGRFVYAWAGRGSCCALGCVVLLGMPASLLCLRLATPGCR
jgi:hypothetical protein